MYLWTRNSQLNFVSHLDSDTDSAHGFWIQTRFAMAEVCTLLAVLIIY